MVEFGPLGDQLYRLFTHDVEGVTQLSRQVSKNKERAWPSVSRGRSPCLKRTAKCCPGRELLSATRVLEEVYKRQLTDAGAGGRCAKDIRLTNLSTHWRYFTHVRKSENGKRRPLRSVPLLTFCVVRSIDEIQINPLN
ncbi:hypothetical protein EVAR_2586_1 [Eumeta japonica]|uniref:Uncharacterized protein n=1 Tax=Eumeta variegata TaxID=151549 RepID=A0A4C1SP68_EUMVA|nr:hypothetical protein EVAR_2586_1 [Eumeta japonica]